MFDMDILAKAEARENLTEREALALFTDAPLDDLVSAADRVRARSEERRVGKECGS